MTLESAIYYGHNLYSIEATLAIAI